MSKRNFDFSKTPGGEILAELKAICDEVFVVPNSWLPVEYHDKVRGGRTLKRLNEMCDKRDGLTEHVKRKAIKADNIENYRKQYENCGEFEYNGQADDLQLSKNMQAMVAGMISGGIIDAEDLIEE